MIQGLPTLSWSRVAPKLSKLSPASGAKRLFGMQALVEFAKTLAKLTVVVTVAVMVLKPHLVALGTLVAVAPAEIGNATGGLVMALVKAVAIPVGALALFDLIYQRRTWFAKLKMSLQELKDEHKDSEGDPKIKAKIRQIAMQRSRRRMMAAVPEATVIITNPTHYAIALKYDHGSMGAPVVVAKGVDTLALKIRTVATEAGVPLVENRPLARALYASAEIGRPIPTDHYAAVAEIIGYVMRLARERAGMIAPPNTSLDRDIVFGEFDADAQFDLAGDLRHCRVVGGRKSARPLGQRTQPFGRGRAGRQFVAQLLQLVEPALGLGDRPAATFGGLIDGRKRDQHRHRCRGWRNQRTRARRCRNRWPGICVGQRLCRLEQIVLDRERGEQRRIEQRILAVDAHNSTLPPKMIRRCIL